MNEFQRAKARAAALVIATTVEDIERIVEYDEPTILRVLRGAPPPPIRPRKPSRGRSLRTRVEDWIERTTDLIESPP